MAVKLHNSTRALLDAIKHELEVTPAVRADFGVVSDRHFAAMSDLVKLYGVQDEELDSLIGNGKKLTELYFKHSGNPGVKFETQWDFLTFKRRDEIDRDREREQRDQRERD